MDWSVPVTLPEADKALTFALACKGQRYDLLTLALIALAKFVPDKWLSRARRKQDAICSRFVLADIKQGGWTAPGWLDRQYAMESPADVWAALKLLTTTEAA